MNKIIHTTKKHIENQKKKYLFLSIILILGIISGILFIFFISKADKSRIIDEFELIFDTINNHKLNYTNTLINSLSLNLLSLLERVLQILIAKNFFVGDMHGIKFK